MPAQSFVAQVCFFPFNFAPKGFAFCNGQILPLSQNTALFSLLGTNYGGNGKSTFALPNLQGQSAIGVGQGNGLSEYFIGQSGGAATQVMLESEMPGHSHTFKVFAGTDDANAQAAPANTVVFGKAPSNGTGPNASASLKLYASGSPTVTLLPKQISTAGGGSPHNNMKPYLALNYCIALQGVYPPR